MCRSKRTLSAEAGEKLLVRQGDNWAIVGTAAPPKPGDGVLKLVQDPTYVSWNYTLRSTDGLIAQHGFSASKTFGAVRTNERTGIWRRFKFA